MSDINLQKIILLKQEYKNLQFHIFKNKLTNSIHYRKFSEYCELILRCIDTRYKVEPCRNLKNSSICKYAAQNKCNYFHLCSDNIYLCQLKSDTYEYKLIEDYDKCVQSNDFDKFIEDIHYYLFKAEKCTDGYRCYAANCKDIHICNDFLCILNLWKYKWKLYIQKQDKYFKDNCDYDIQLMLYNETEPNVYDIWY